MMITDLAPPPVMWYSCVSGKGCLPQGNIPMSFPVWIDHRVILIVHKAFYLRYALNINTINDQSLVDDNSRRLMKSSIAAEDHDQ